MNNFEIGVSYLTAKTLGLIDYKTEAFSKQAYFMFGENCSYNCAFCAQAKEVNFDKNYLSRVKWPKFEYNIIKNKLEEAILNNKIEKACFQVVSFKGYFQKFVNFLKVFRKDFNIPISASISVNSIKMVEELFDAGLNKIGYAIDCVSDKYYKEVKGRDFKKDFSLLINLSLKFREKISTHAIYGLGESDKEFINFYIITKLFNIDFGLFNFTPIKNTRFSNREFVSVEKYRKIQIILSIIDYLFQIIDSKYFLDILNKNNLLIKENEIIIEKDFDLKKIDFFHFFIFDENNFDFIGFRKNDFFDSFNSLKKFLFDINDIKNGIFLMTRGCKGCNRPYYNEKPSETIYNYFYKPEEETINYWIEKYLSIIKIC